MSSISGYLPWLILAACTVYAVVRYVGFGDVRPDQVPVFVLNKGVSFGGLIVLAWSRCDRDRRRRHQWGVFGVVCVALHVVLSLTILQPAYFGRFYDKLSGFMTWQAELSMLTGAVAALLLAWLFSLYRGPAESDPHSARPRARGLARAMLALSGIHIGLIGYGNWLTPDKWYGYLPPITLLCCLAVVTAVVWPTSSVRGQRTERDGASSQRLGDKR